MNVRLLVFVFLLSLVILMGCAKSSGVFPTGVDTYTIIMSGQGQVSKRELVQKAYAEANTFCAQSGKVMQPIATSYNKNVWTAESSYELQFRALDKDDPEVARPNLKPIPDTIIEVK